MSAIKLGCPSLVLIAFLMVGSGHYAGAQPLGANPSAASSDIGNPNSINPAARASDIGNPSAIKPSGAVSQIPRSSTVSPRTPAQAMPRVARPSARVKPAPFCPRDGCLSDSPVADLRREEPASPRTGVRRAC
jgi:hypothetical protein